ncbi:hypothetical protein D3C84_952390 [compost metagenome]
MAVNTTTERMMLPMNRLSRRMRICWPVLLRTGRARLGMKSASSTGISSDSAASPQKAPRQPIRLAATVPKGMPNSVAAAIPR